jgi:hypothetical protein
MALRLCGQVTSASKNQQLISVGVYYFLTKLNTMKIFNLVRHWRVAKHICWTKASELEFKCSETLTQMFPERHPSQH